MRYQKEVLAVVLRKGTTHIGGRIGDIPMASRGTTLAYALEIRMVEPGGTYTIYLERNRSKDFYRIPIGSPLLLSVGRFGDRIGRWLDGWRIPDSSPGTK